jgi:hypothetical protein
MSAITAAESDAIKAAIDRLSEGLANHTNSTATLSNSIGALANSSAELHDIIVRNINSTISLAASTEHLVKFGVDLAVAVAHLAEVVVTTKKQNVMLKCLVSSFEAVDVVNLLKYTIKDIQRKKERIHHFHDT